jgi:aspartate aminotransferase-like enzyme/GNAT superfamily N-acetyltransferase
MEAEPSLVFKIATEPWEFEQIYRLNYETFVEEIPQHGPNSDGRLVDRFDAENTYLICLQGRELVGMIAVRDRRPFSLDEKLPDLESYLPPARSLCEMRLLSVRPGHRNGLVFRGLMKLLEQYCLGRGYDLAVISGAAHRVELYRRLGFVPFGPMVGTPPALFQPMYLTLNSWQERAADFLRASRASSAKRIFLPGPVSVHREVRRALSQPPVSHRADGFVEDFQETKRMLCEFAGARHVEILLGSGTLANDVIAAQLSLRPGRGLVLSNGEFGERLIDHASRFALDFEPLAIAWGETFDLSAVQRHLEQGGMRWLWAVHCETSTGVLNDLEGLKRLCRSAGALLCVDCVSSIGTVPLDLGGVHLASGASGKGLGAFPGLSLVFYNEPIAPAPARLPRYLDLGFYAENRGVPFTFSSNLLYALKTALARFDRRKAFHETAALARWLRQELRGMGLTIVADDAHTAPAVITIALPASISVERLGAELEREGFYLSYKSRYLLERNWIQICLMGDYSSKWCVALLQTLRERLAAGQRSRVTPPPSSEKHH